MLRIDPELLTSASDSKYRAAFERGHRWLRFSPDVEREFQEVYTDAHLLRIRLAGYLAIVLSDYLFFPERLWTWRDGCAPSTWPRCPSGYRRGPRAYGLP